MRIDLVLIPAVLALAASMLVAVKPVEYHKADLSALFLYWPEAYRHAERGRLDVAPLVVCNASGVLKAPPGLAYKALGLVCRFKP
ncbi:MAG: hypothetical protein ABWK05_08455 [Pyrobaculum sp.]